MERIPHKDQEKQHLFSSSYTFDSVKINLISNDPQTMDFCNEYFELYSQIDTATQDRDWTVAQRVDLSAQTHYWEADEKNKMVTVFGKDYDSKLTMRIIRSLVMLEDINIGKVMFKGGAFVNKDGQGIALMGEKRSGKTSLLMGYMLRNDQTARFVTNSHVALSLEGEHVCAYGYPISVGVRLNVLEGMQKRGNERVTPVIDDLKSNLQPGGENRYYIEPMRLAKYLNGRIASKTELNKIILVKSVSANTFSNIRKLTIDEVEDYFRNYYIKHLKSDGWHKLYKVDANQHINSIRRMLEKVDLYELSFNINNHTDNLNLLDQI